MIRIPYITVRQRSETFFLTRFKAGDLLNHVNFHYREPYGDITGTDSFISNEKYIEEIRQKGIRMESNEEGIQRRLQIDRMNSIKAFIEENSQNFLPNTVILSADISAIDDSEEKYSRYEESDTGHMEFPDDFHFSIIDGQHRLAGLTIVQPRLVDEFEIPAVILFNVSIPVAAKLFADINGKQKSVNKSLIYDLYSQIDSEEMSEIQLLHAVCEALYKSEESPLFRQIKMLGIGSGAISQAFFIDYARKALRQTHLLFTNTQEILNHLVYYFRAYQKTFPEDWPVPYDQMSTADLDNYAHNVLKVRNSQLVKTNGFGAILRAFPLIYSLATGDPSQYLRLVEMQKGRMNWIKPSGAGTGTAYQKSLLNQIEAIYKSPLLFSDDG